MRKTSEIEGGTFERPYGGTIDMPRQQVRILRAHERRADEDMYVVTSMADNREILVPGDSLDPHPELPETNVEFVTRMMEFSRQGALMQAFVLTAIERYAALVKVMPQDQRDGMNRSMLPYDPWARCADEAILLTNERNGEKG